MIVKRSEWPILLMAVVGCFGAASVALAHHGGTHTKFVYEDESKSSPSATPKFRRMPV